MAEASSPFTLIVNPFMPAHPVVGVVAKAPTPVKADTPVEINPVAVIKETALRPAFFALLLLSAALLDSRFNGVFTTIPLFVVQRPFATRQ